jgi:hypothetical protein
MPSMLGRSGRLWGREGARAPVSPAAHRCQMPLSAVRTGGPGNHRQDDPVSSVEISSSRARCGVDPLFFALKDEQCRLRTPYAYVPLPTLPGAFVHRRARYEASGVTPRPAA